MKKYLPVLVVPFLLAAPAKAEDAAALQNKIERMQRDLNLLQKQIYSGEEVEGAVEQDVPAADAAGDPEAHNETMRKVNGRMEELEHRIQKLQQDFDKYKADVDLRFKDLEAAKAAHAEEGEASAAKPAEKAEEKSEEKAADEKETVKKSASDSRTFASPQEHYSYAFKQLNAAKFDSARESLEGFIEAYPEDKLIGNAYYWLGEINYVKRDYVKASDYFRQGFEKKPDGQKAADNLFKLGLSLSAQDKNKEACIIFGQLKTKFPKMSDNLKQNLEAEKKRISCK